MIQTDDHGLNKHPGRIQTNPSSLAFGKLHKPRKPSSKFENKLFTLLRACDNKYKIFVEIQRNEISPQLFLHWRWRKGGIKGNITQKRQ